MRTAGAQLADRVPPALSFTLPVSGLEVSLSQPTGAEDLLLADHSLGDPRLVLALVRRLAEAREPIDWAQLTVTDADTLILRLRQIVVGARISANVPCIACSSRVEFSFGVEPYLEHHQPRRASRRDRAWTFAPLDGQPGWHGLERRGVEAAAFRLPTLADQIAAASARDPAATMAERCIRPGNIPGGVRTRCEMAMEQLAPVLAGPLQGQCPDCGAAIAARFEARQYCLQELRDRSRFVYDDIDVLAERYHWSERAILRLPHARRASYAERARQARQAS